MPFNTRLINNWPHDLWASRRPPVSELNFYNFVPCDVIENLRWIRIGYICFPKQAWIVHKDLHKETLVQQGCERVTKVSIAPLYYKLYNYNGYNL